MLKSRDMEQLLTQLHKQQQEVQRQISALQQIDRKLRRRMSSIEDFLHAEQEVIRERYFEARKIALLRREIPVGNDLEYPLRELDRLYNMESVMFLGKVGLSVSKEDLEAERYGRFSSIFVLIEEEDRYQGVEEALPAGNYLTSVSQEPMNGQGHITIRW